jgi:hypothetical protein
VRVRTKYIPLVISIHLLSSIFASVSTSSVLPKSAVLQQKERALKNDDNNKQASNTCIRVEKKIQNQSSSLHLWQGGKEGEREIVVPLLPSYASSL